MNDTAIKVEHISKYYRLGVINHGMLYKDIQSWLAKKSGRQDPHAKLSTQYFDDRPEGFWALKDLNFEIKMGDRVGIIGKNGAGKSTFLKVLSRITAPTEGTAKIRGRVASLLEVGTGFSQELTGRENIYLNGAIMGMKRREVARKLDEIIAFSGIENHIDTPAKRYSSGMYVRLAFSVAAHLDGDILIADEVLAVGDAGFQKKALGKMEELSTGLGRTVLFVSHNMAAVKQLCTRGVVLEKGRIVDQNDDILVLINRYLHDAAEVETAQFEWVNDGSINDPEFTPIKLQVLETDGSTPKLPILAEKDYLVDLEFSIRDLNPKLNFCLSFTSDEEVVIFTSSPFSSIDGYAPRIGENHATCRISGDLLSDRRYRIELQARIQWGRWILEPGRNAPFLYFKVDKKKDFGPHANLFTGQIAPFLPWLTT